MNVACFDNYSIINCEGCQIDIIETSYGFSIAVSRKTNEKLTELKTIRFTKFPIDSYMEIGED